MVSRGFILMVFTIVFPSPFNGSSGTDACFRTIPSRDIIMSRNERVPCTVGTTPFGTFSPASGTQVPSGNAVTLTCNPATRTDDPAALTGTCTNGVLPNYSTCTPCPDDTWIFDSTTNRCFKGFFDPLAPAACDFTGFCQSHVPNFGVPVDVGQTLNIQKLFDAAQLGTITTGSVGMFIGIVDPITNEVYQLYTDLTPVPAASLTPFFGPGKPDADPTNSNQQIFFRPFGLDNEICGTAAMVCQLQLTE
uniref:Uncharacterized protein n=1 Tax=Plectus sambesii TaxID=2011161 RepID=A0A914WMT5_9BILA